MDISEHWKPGILLITSIAIGLVPLLIASRYESGMLKVRVATIAMSSAFYFSAVGIFVFEKAGLERSIELFGQRPLGLPIYVFVPLLFFILGSPVPHFVRYGFTKMFLRRGMLHPRELPADWDRQHRIALWIVIYFVLLLFIWIAYCELRGI